MGLDKSEGYITRQSMEGIEAEATGLLIKFGHLKQGESLPHILRNQLQTKLHLVVLRKTCESIQNARTVHGDHYLDVDRFLSAVNFGLRDLSGLRLSALVQAKDLSEFNLTNSEIDGVIFESCNLSGANLSGATVSNGSRGTIFRGSYLQRAEIPRIRIQNTLIDLTEGSLGVEDPQGIWDVYKDVPDDLGSCSASEEFNKCILSYIGNGVSKRNADFIDYSRRGVILFQEGHPLGYMKLKGERSFLPMRTVKNKKEEVVFWKGMIYELGEDFRHWLDNASAPYRKPDMWRRADVEVIAHTFAQEGSEGVLGRDNIRFLSDPSIFPKLTELTRRIEEGEEQLVDVLPTESARYRHSVLDKEI